MKDYMTIKDFSNFTGIDVPTLRYWDNIGLFCPEKRGPENGYRYYSLNQVIAVNFITVLKDLNVPLCEIGDIEKTRTPEAIIEMLEKQERLLDKRMQQLRDAYSIIHTRREMIKRGLKANFSDITVRSMPEKKIIIGPSNNFEEGKAFYEPFKRFCNSASDLRIHLSYPIGGLHNSSDSFLSAPEKPDHFFSIDPSGNVEVPAGNYVVGYIRGYYGELGDFPGRMAAYVQEHSLSLVGPLYHSYLHDEIVTNDPSEYISQISIRINN